MTKRSQSILVLFAALLSVAGCAVFPDTAPTTSWLKRPRPDGVLDHKIVLLEIAILERPLGDPFLNQELWQHTDEMIVDLDRKAAVEDNGFRVGQIVGMTPGKLQDLLKSKRYCGNPWRSVVPSGNTTALYLGGVWPRCEFLVQQGRHTNNLAFDQARFCLDVKTTLTSDNKTRLSFLPKVENGEIALPFHPDPKQQSWTIRVERPCQTFQELSWDVVLAPGEYLVIGGILEKENSLGHRSFVQEEGNSVQRLLVLRTSRAQNSDEANGEALARNHASPCLAAQASMTSIRASGE